MAQNNNIPSLVPPISSMPFVNIVTGILSPPAYQFLQKIYNALAGANAIGQWQPTLQGSVANGQPMYSTQTGIWRKINQLTWFSGVISITDLGGLSGDISISGLPYNANGSSLVLVNYSSLFLSIAYTDIIGITSDGISTISINQKGSEQLITSLTDQNMSNISSITVVGSYAN